MNTGVLDVFSRLCSLMREGRVGHIEELLKCNASSSEQEINYRTSDVAPEVTKKHIFFKCFGYHTQTLGCCFLSWTGKLDKLNPFALPHRVVARAR